MTFHWVSVSVVPIKVASYLAPLHHSAADLGILQRQQTLDLQGEQFSAHQLFWICYVHGEIVKLPKNKFSGLNSSR